MAAGDKYIEVDKFYQAINDVKGAINDLGQSLGDKIDKNKESFDAAILKIHIDYTERLTILETQRTEDREQAKGEWKTRLLYSACAAMGMWIVNHIFK